MAKERERHHHEDLLTKITKKIEYFIVKHLKIIVISVSSVIIVLAIYFSVDYFFSRKEEKAQGAFDKVYMVYTDILNKEDMSEEELNKKLIDLNEDFIIVLNEYPKSKSATKSAFYIGNTLYNNEQYDEAAIYYEQGAFVTSKYYISFLCLKNLASCYEQLDEYEKAIETYNKIEDLFIDEFITPTILFNRGQLYEKLNKFEKANDEYARIISDYPWSSWKEFAEKRQLLIKNFM